MPQFDWEIHPSILSGETADIYFERTVTILIVGAGHAGGAARHPEVWSRHHAAPTSHP